MAAHTFSIGGHTSNPQIFYNFTCLHGVAKLKQHSQCMVDNEMKAGLPRWKIATCTFVLWVMAFIDASANHIVGGEIEFITISPGRYRLNLIQYRDDAQTENDTILPAYDIYLFPNASKQIKHIQQVTLQSVEEVFYTKPECAIAQLKTLKVVWSAEFDLDPKEYADEAGYYWTWERCCRNADIKNIPNPSDMGMKYALDIPPLWKDGAPFINSSPELLRPLSDYACVNQLYYTSFTGTDRDGDSLVYRLANPLGSPLDFIGNPDPALPIPKPKPHLEIRWQSGYSLSNVVPGAPALSISSKGLLTVAPLDMGLFVFSVIVEEWRDQKKIGEVQRDFQMLVVDNCLPPAPPEVSVKVPGREGFDPDKDILTYGFSDNRCLNFIVTNIADGEIIQLRAEGVNFDDANLEGLFSANNLKVAGQDSLIVQFCVPQCPPLKGEPFIIDLIAGDDACPLPQLDTVRLKFQVEPPPNELPVITGLPSSYSLAFDQSTSIAITATDADGQLMVSDLLGEGALSPADIGVSFQVQQSNPGRLEGQFVWNTDCSVYDFSEIQDFRVGLVIDDEDTCDEANEPVWVDLHVVLPPNNAPVLTLSDDTVVVSLDGTVSVQASLLDGDNDQVVVYSPEIQNGTKRPGTFPRALGTGAATSAYTWEVKCPDLALFDDDYLSIWILGKDEGGCKDVNVDSALLVIQLDMEENLAPVFEPVEDASIFIGETWSTSLIANDQNVGDSVFIEFLYPNRLPRTNTLNLVSIPGLGKSEATLEWSPECSLIDGGTSGTSYTLELIAYDNACAFMKVATQEVTIEVKDTQAFFDEFLPPNVFTPNGDGVNDVFTLSGLANPTQNLPPDGCDDVFESFTVFDRTGKSIFFTKSRDFMWDGRGSPSGVYFYQARYSSSVFKGTIQVLR